MNTRGNDGLRELLAAEYALGTLRGAARRRFETWLVDDADLAVRAAAWQERLSPLMHDVPSRRPPQRVWDAIEARLPGDAGARVRPVVAPAPSSPSWWDRVALWRGASAAFAAIALFAIVTAWKAQHPAAPAAPVAVAPSPAIAVASIADPKSGKLVATVLQTRGGSLVVKVADDVDVPAHHTLQLWSTADGKTLVSMGLVASNARQQAIEVRPGEQAALASAVAFGLSLEPAGGSPQPTKVLGLGHSVHAPT